MKELNKLYDKIYNEWQYYDEKYLIEQKKKLRIKKLKRIITSF